MMRSMIRCASFAALVLSGLTAACGGGSTSTVTCDPATDPACVAPDGAVDDDSSIGLDDGSVPTADIGAAGTYPDGARVLPDGAIVLPDGNIIGPDGAIIGCVPGATQCTNCKDDDGDGLVDWLDPECTGPLDNDEGSYATGIPGDNVDPCKQDCWFDGNSGSGNDGCLFPSKCLPGSKEPKCPYDPKAAADPKQCPPPSEKCIKYCKPLTPKGCDCAGCCQVFDGAGKMYTVKLVSTCTSESLADDTKCPKCTQVVDCTNPCGKCDWCLGKTSLPPECYPPPPSDAGTPGDGGTPPFDGGMSACPSGLAACSPTSPCPTGQYCLTGCCIKPPS